MLSSFLMPEQNGNAGSSTATPIRTISPSRTLKDCSNPKPLLGASSASIPPIAPTDRSVLPRDAELLKSAARSEGVSSIVPSSFPKKRQLVYFPIVWKLWRKGRIQHRDMDSEERGGPKVEDTNFTQNNKDANVGPITSGMEDIVDGQREQAVNADSPATERAIKWEVGTSDAPEIPTHFKKVAESKFPIKVEDFFDLFFSNNAVDFVESFHRKCGDKDFNCNPWYPHEQLGQAREISFQHPIKVYFGAKYGGCKEVQSFRVYRNSHVIINMCQEVNDVPYAYYFQVKGIWDVQSDGDQSEDGCILQVYINVAFSKKTVWKGKIEQSTKEECREACATWIELAHEVLKQRNLEKRESPVAAAEIGQTFPKDHERIAEPIGKLLEDHTLARKASLDPQGSHQQTEAFIQATLFNISTLASLFRTVPAKCYSLLESPGNGGMLYALVFAVIFVLIQLSIVVLLGRTQQVYVISQVDVASGAGYRRGGADAVPWLEKRVLLLKEEMLLVETQLDRMRHEHMLIKARLSDLEHLKKKHV